MNALTLLKVVVGVVPLNHVGTSCFTGEQIWWDVINGGHPEETRSLTVVLPDAELELSTENYRNRGGVTNSELKRWLENHDMANPDTKLLFDVHVDEDHNVVYTFIGSVNEL